MTTVSRIMEHVHRGTIGTVYSLLDGEYEFIEAKISEKSELVNKKIRDANFPEDIRIGAVIRKDQVIEKVKLGLAIDLKELGPIIFHKVE